MGDELSMAENVKFPVGKCQFVSDQIASVTFSEVRTTALVILDKVEKTSVT
jgi:hypothetical protein